MPPGRVRSTISRPRAATSRQASSSENTPATYAAAYSPMLWPATQVGSTPRLFQNAASATSTAKIAGCVKSVRSSSAASSP
ncbi:MAG: hypothetical protein R3F34_16240 [Planctomycetota bacterium]